MIVVKEYLIRKRGTCVAHIWLGNDTACRMYSTGGLRPEKYRVITSHLSHWPVCHMCQNVAEMSEIEVR